MLEIKDLHASVNGKEILKGINLSIKKGEVHAIMGPNGSLGVFPPNHNVGVFVAPALPR